MKRIIVFIFFIMFLTTGCSSQNYNEQINALTQQIEELEEQIEEQEEKISELEDENSTLKEKLDNINFSAAMRADNYSDVLDDIELEAEY